MIYIGIDPGKDGAMAVITPDNVSVFPYGKGGYKNALDGLRGFAGNCRCCLERVGAMPDQGRSSIFNFGENFGIIQGMLIFAEVPYQLVLPRTWKKEFGLTSDKQRSIDVCKRLFPGVSLRRTDRCRKDHDGMAEALLMAEYARRRF